MGWHGERWAAQSGKHHRLYLFVYDTWLRGTVNVRPRAPRDSPRSRRQSPVRRRARGRRDLSCSWAPDPRHVSRCRAAALPRPGGTCDMAAARGCRVRVGRFLCFDLPGGRPYALPFRVSSSTYCYRTRSHAPPPARRSTRRASSRDTMPRGGARNGARTPISCYELDVPDCRRLGTYTVWSSIVYAMDTPHGAVLGNYTLHVY